MKTTIRLTLLSSLALCAALAQAQTLEQLVNDALASEIRTPGERERDANRKPLETLEFFGLTPEMTVLELVPAGGWYTKVLAPVLKDEGRLYVAIMVDTVRELKAEHESMSAVEVLDTGSDFRFSYQMDEDAELTDTSFGISGVDMVLTFRNLHNFTPDVRALLDRAVYDVLKPGGIYGVVDHTRRHMEPTTRENGRRMDPVLAIKEIQAAGFVFEDFTDLHYRPEDELLYEVGHPDVTGRTDRFTLRFRKPVDAEEAAGLRRGRGVA